MTSGLPIVVGGCHRSGTSLVRRVLDAHSRIHCGPELPFFRDFYGDYHDDPLRHLRFVETVRSVVTEEEALDVLGPAFVELHERAAGKAGKVRWADKAPENVLHTAGWQRLLGDRWLFVHVVRNPLDCVASMRGRFPLTLPAGLEELAAWYRRYVEAGLAFADAHPERSTTVVYEELCAEPERVVAELMAFLGEAADPRQLVFNAVSHQTGLEDPSVAATERVHGRSVGKWREALTEAETALVWAQTGEIWRRAAPAGEPRESLGLG